MIRTTVRMKKELHEKLRKESFETGESINSIIVGLIKNKYKEEKEMFKLVQKDHGEETLLVEGTLEELVDYLQENQEVYNWVQDEDPGMELPELENIETIRELEYELEKIDLDWWTLEIEVMQ